MRKLLVFLWLASWLYLCLIPALEAGTASYAAWREAGCPSFESALPQGLCPPPSTFGRGFLMWLISAPLLAWALLRTPAKWPARITHIAWNSERPLFSLVSLLVYLGVVISVMIGAIRAPYAAAAISNAIALVPVIALGAWYRAAALSAEA